MLGVQRLWAIDGSRSREPQRGLSGLGAHLRARRRRRQMLGVQRLWAIDGSRSREPQRGLSGLGAHLRARRRRRQMLGVRRLWAIDGSRLGIFAHGGTQLPVRAAATDTARRDEGVETQATMTRPLYSDPACHRRSAHEYRPLSRYGTRASDPDGSVPPEADASWVSASRWDEGAPGVSPL